jgi:hypothetical protein
MNDSQLQKPSWADKETLNAVRPEVRKILESSSAFQSLPFEMRKKLASDLVKVGTYLASPEGVRATELEPPKKPLARAQEDGVEDTKTRLSKAPGFAGKDFEGGAIQQGTQQFGELVKKVDFPMFVSGLIQNVFQAIVDSSIQQMQAYGELLANVAKTVDQFAQDNITGNNARDWLAGRFPDDLEVSTPDEMSSGFAEGETTPPPAPVLTVKGEDPEASLKKISTELNLPKPLTDLSNEEDEQRLVMAARLQLARQRQQMLSSMVMLGINRIVVTDGLINAKVVFDMRASDVARRQASASMYDKSQLSNTTSVSAKYGGWFTPVSANVNSTTSYDHVATVESSVNESSESKAELKAKLSGEVRVNFKSDYFPMEKLANPQMIAAIQGNAKPVETPAPPAAAAKA